MILKILNLESNNIFLDLGMNKQGKVRTISKLFE